MGLPSNGEVARRLGLLPPSDAARWSEPWRWVLFYYLSMLLEVADFERTAFTRTEAKLALEVLVREGEDMIKRLSR